MARVLIAAGASGGHVYPALATAVVLRDRGHEVVFAGGDRLEARVVPEAGFAFHAIPVRRPPSVRRELVTPRGIAAIASIAAATFRGRRLLRTVAPDAVLGMGGFAAVPVTLAATRSRAPLVLHEQNAHLSLAQRIPLRWSRVLALGLPIAEPVTHPRVELVGNPVRARIAALATLDPDERAARRRVARERLGLDPDMPTLLVLGGSLGAGPLNERLPGIAMPAGVQVLHLAGVAHETKARNAWALRRDARARVVGFVDDMEDAYVAADVAVSRSGASTVSELALAALPSILVPLPTLARGDQEANARVLERAGGAIVVLQSDERFIERLTDEISRLFANRVAREAMAAAARTVARVDAAERLSDVIESVCAARHTS